MTVFYGAREAIKHLMSHNEAGQDVLEYAFLAGLLSIAAVAVIVLVGPYLQNAFQDIISAVNSA